MKWQPIQPLSDADMRAPVHVVDIFKRAFDAQSHAAEAHGADLEALFEQIRREFAVETGMLERLYDLDRGTTTLLIEEGFQADLISRDSTDTDPLRLVGILRDQQEGIEIVYDWVAGRRPLTTSGIKELHRIITRNQETVTGQDSLGRVVETPLRRGEWKIRPNNPTRGDGGLHEYCPPLHVASEMERLVDLFNSYEDVHPVILAAWLHHRFTQIHPFQDGNGRVARSLMSFVLLRGELVPLVIDRDQRSEYIDFLERADAGDLRPLTEFFVDRLLDRMTRLLGKLSQAPTPHARASAAAFALQLAEAQKETTRRELPKHPGAWWAAMMNELAQRLTDLVADVSAPFEERFPQVRPWFVLTPPLHYGILQEEPHRSLWKREPHELIWPRVRELVRRKGYPIPESLGGAAWRIWFPNRSLGYRPARTGVLCFDIVETPGNLAVLGSGDAEAEDRPFGLAATILFVDLEPGDLRQDECAWPSSEQLDRMPRPPADLDFSRVEVEVAVDAIALFAQGEPVDEAGERFEVFANRALTTFLQALVQ
ncbi:MAG: Fic family protein [Myxococcota bacterium]